jgi:hypothetical protein
MLWIQIILILPHSDEELETTDTESKDTRNLDGQSRNENICTSINLHQSAGSLPRGQKHTRCWFVNGTHCTSNALDDQTDQIACYEEDRVRLGTNPADVLAIHHDNSSQAQIDGRSNKNRPQRQADQVPEKVCSVEWVAMQEDSSNVATRFKCQTNQQRETY